MDMLIILNKVKMCYDSTVNQSINCKFAVNVTQMRRVVFVQKCDCHLKNCSSGSIVLNDNINYQMRVVKDISQPPLSGLI